MTTDSKSYQTFNTVTFEANVFNVDVVDGQYGEYAAVTLIGNFATDDGGFTIRFNNSNGILGLFRKGHLMNGRRVMVTGRIESVAQVYFDKKDGQTKMLKRPQITLDSRTVQVNLDLCLPQLALRSSWSVLVHLSSIRRRPPVRFRTTVLTPLLTKTVLPSSDTQEPLTGGFFFTF